MTGTGRGGRTPGGGGGPVVALALAAALLAASPATAQQPVATGTLAVRGAAWGAAVGGVLGGLGLGTLAWGLCDAAECDGTFADGFVVGALLGGAAGAGAGTVIGSAFPRGGAAVGGWSWTARVGGRAALAGDVDGVGPDLGLEVARGVTDRVRVGVAAEYLGRAEDEYSFQVQDRDGVLRTRTVRRSWDLSGVRMQAERLFAPGARRTAWLSLGVGVYPTRESSRRTDDDAPPAYAYSEWTPAPGLSLGAGVRLPVADRWSVELGGRGDLALGVGSDDWLPLLRVGVGLRRDPPPRP